MFTPTAAEITRNREIRREAKARAAGLPQLIGVGPGDEIQFDHGGRTHRARFMVIEEWVRGRRLDHHELLVRNVGNNEARYRVDEISNIRRAAPLSDDCETFQLDPATADRKVRRCLCGLSERLH